MTSIPEERVPEVIEPKFAWARGNSMPSFLTKTVFSTSFAYKRNILRHLTDGR